MTQYVYAGATNSGRIIRLGAPVLTQITDAGTEAPLSDFKTWPYFPAGPSGIVTFRLLSVTLWSSAGYNVRVTPIVDDVELSAQDFSSATTGQVVIPAWFASRGRSVACRVQELTRLGELKLIDIQIGFRIIRATP